MNLLVVGGSGYVGSLVLPMLAQHHQLRIFDLRPPVDPAWEYVPGDVRDLDSISHAMTGIDVLIYMAMGLKDSPENPREEQIKSGFDVSVKGLYLALLAAQQSQVQAALYLSTISIYGLDTDVERRYFISENLTPEAKSAYGLTKFLGEEVCRFAARNWHMHVNVLRLCWPRSIEDWQAQAYRGTPTPKTSADDLARALLAALQFRQGFQLFNLSGDYDQQIIKMRKAKRLLHWAPLARPIKAQREKISRRVMKRSLRRWLAKFSYAIGRR